MNTDELRVAFTYGQALEERIARFRHERIDAIRKREAPTSFDAGPIMIVHAIPLVSLADPPTLTFSRLELLQPPLGGGGHNFSYALEGVITHNPQAYTLHFRNGVLEGVAPCRTSSTPKGGISLTRLEIVLGQALRGYFRYWEEENVRGPYVFYVSLLNIRDTVAIVPEWVMDEAPAIRRVQLELPSQVFNDADTNANTGVLLRPTFDLLWNGFEHARSPNYDNAGGYRAQ
jgi:hypothetical protein